MPNGGKRGSRVRDETDKGHRSLQFAMNCLFSLILLCAALYVILSGRFAGSTLHWAFGIAGTLIGAWLRPTK